MSRARAFVQALEEARLRLWEAGYRDAMRLLRDGVLADFAEAEAWAGPVPEAMKPHEIVGAMLRAAASERESARRTRETLARCGAAWPTYMRVRWEVDAEHAEFLAAELEAAIRQF